MTPQAGVSSREPTEAFNPPEEKSLGGFSLHPHPLQLMTWSYFFLEIFNLQGW